MAHTRRDFLKTTLATAALGAVPVRAAKRSATDWVTLGKSGVKVTRLAFGTGTFSGRVQRELGQEGFNRLVRHAYDRGIRFFETADNYRGMPQMLATALKGVPRDSYKLMTKFALRDSADPRPVIERYRKDLDTDYFDILLMHCVRSPKWHEELQRVEDEISEAKVRKIVVGQGASVHGLPALRAFPGNKWLEIAMIRMNHNGVKMDTESTRDVNEAGNVDEVVRHTRKVHGEGMGVISMKLAGEGAFTTREDRLAALKFTMALGVVDSVTIGFKSAAEIDEAIENMDRALNG
jgi:aryl-alcohol dehydrogenase-like predicted oxidoreductase